MRWRGSRRRSLSTPETLAAGLARLVRREQRDRRLPSIAAAVLRDGEVVWEDAVGAADVRGEREATPDTQYRVGSITKTFTAAAIMQLRDAGKLDLEDALDTHVDGAAHRPTLRRLLSHTSGLQRETHDDAWVVQRFADVPELLETLDRAEQVLPAGARYHYSNLAFALLGVVVERASGVPYAEYVRTRLLEPLGLARTSFEPQEPAAVGYLVQPYAEGVWDEAPVRTGAWISAGQLWGTVRDLCRWAAFLADPDESVLSRESVEEMRTVLTIDDHERWTGGYGLGVMLRREGERILAGHNGSMPGFIASMFVSPGERIGAVTLTNSSTATLTELTLRLATTAADAWPVPPRPWRIEQPPPEEIASVLGLWFLESSPVIFRWRDRTLEARHEDDPDWKPPAVFRRETADRWRIASGWERGEQLRLERDASGTVTRMILAGYPVTREPTVWV